MGIPILIVGGTGTGKSTSLRNLPRTSTAILNAELKPLPFRNSKFTLNGNVTSTTQLINMMKALEKKDEIEYVVFDSITMYAGGPVFKEMVEGIDGFEGWSNFKYHILSIINQMKISKKNYIVTALEEQVADHTLVKTCSAAIQGSLKGGGLESHFSMALRAQTVDDIDSPSGVRYVFATNKIPGERITSKTPLGMFDELYVDNDVVEIYKVINEYYK